MTLFCIEQNIWTDVKEYLEAIGYYDLFVMAQYFLDTDDYFKRGIKMFTDMYKEKMPDIDVDSLVEAMLNFAFDGYEILNEDAEEEIDVSTTANNAGL